MAWSGAAGLVGGLLYARLMPASPPHVDIAILVILGVFFIGLFLYGIYLGDPEGRGVRRGAFSGPFFLVGGIVIWVARPFLRRPGRRRAKPKGNS
jgi:hypothetical protein